MFPCTLALLGVGVALGVALIIVFALPFELSAGLQAAQKTAAVSKSSKVIVRRILSSSHVYQEVPAVNAWGPEYKLVGCLT